jgi:hypothetical protein
MAMTWPAQEMGLRGHGKVIYRRCQHLLYRIIAGDSVDLDPFTPERISLSDAGANRSVRQTTRTQAYPADTAVRDSTQQRRFSSKLWNSETTILISSAKFMARELKPNCGNYRVLLQERVLAGSDPASENLSLGAYVLPRLMRDSGRRWSKHNSGSACRCAIRNN